MSLVLVNMIVGALLAVGVGLWLKREEYYVLSIICFEIGILYVLYMASLL